MELREQYNKNRYLVEHKPGYVEKWSPVVIGNFKINNKKCIKEIALFLEVYSMIEQNLNSLPRWQTMPNVVNNYGYISMSDALSLLKHDIENFIINDVDTKLNIIHEYFNVVNGKRGLLLEHNIRVEDGELLNKKHQDKIDDILLKIVHKRIDYILSSSMRKQFDRELKIKRILKD
jgi:hypothetical protein